ncbi:MAG: GNAT family N-acetyltransferase [Candidatus Nanopelagicales bacterium]
MTTRRPWPATLAAGDVGLRPLRYADSARWREVRRRNAEWLQEWEASVPPEAVADGDAAPTFGMMVRRLRREAREGRTLPWALTYQGRLVGQVTVGGISWGSLRAAYVGYWVDREVAGRGIAPTAVAMACDHCFDVLRLHRIEINIRPENAASLRVVEKLGLRREGERAAYLHINGQWRDHVTFVAYAGEVPEGLLSRFAASSGVD